MGHKNAHLRALAVSADAGRHGAPALAIGRAVADKPGSPEYKLRLGLAMGCALVRRRLACATRNNRFALPQFAGPR